MKTILTLATVFGLGSAALATTPGLATSLAASCCSVTGACCELVMGCCG